MAVLFSSSISRRQCPIENILQQLCAETDRKNTLLSIVTASIAFVYVRARTSSMYSIEIGHDLLLPLLVHHNDWLLVHPSPYYICDVLGNNNVIMMTSVLTNKNKHREYRHESLNSEH